MPISKSKAEQLIRSATENDIQERTRLLAVLNQHQGSFFCQELELVEVLRSFHTYQILTAPKEQGTVSGVTRHASNINVFDLQLLKKASRVILLSTSSDPTIDELLNRPEPAPGTLDTWDINLTEPAQRPMYFEEIKKHIPQKCGDAQLESHDVKDKMVSQQFAGMKFRVSAKNDEMIAPRLYHNTPLLGAVVGVELKKRLGWQGIRQGEAEWLLFAHDIHYPFCQFVTDLNVGGVAYYCTGKQEGTYVLTCRVLKGMDAFWTFFTNLLTDLPANFATEQLLTAEMFDSPKRIRFVVE